jgi:hypothetical protein
VAIGEGVLTQHSVCAVAVAVACMAVVPPGVLDNLKVVSVMWQCCFVSAVGTILSPSDRGAVDPVPAARAHRFVVVVAPPTPATLLSRLRQLDQHGKCNISTVAFQNGGRASKWLPVFGTSIHSLLLSSQVDQVVQNPEKSESSSAAASSKICPVLTHLANFKVVPQVTVCASIWNRCAIHTDMLRPDRECNVLGGVRPGPVGRGLHYAHPALLLLLHAPCSNSF